MPLAKPRLSSTQKAPMERHITRLLTWTGIATMLPGLQFLLPVQMLRLSGMDVTDAAGLFYARHWGLLVLCFGGLLVYVAKRPALRRPVIFAATVEKAGLAMLVLLAWNEPALRGMRIPAVFDSLCVLIYGLYLWRSAPGKQDPH